jgi:DNA-binding transcriptional MerR regulator
MRIGELATAAGVSASRIRFYETAGLLVPDGRTQAGYRIYGEPALQALRIIEQAQLAGFTLAEIKAILPPRPGEWNRETLLAALRRKLTAIEDMQQQLARSERRLRAVIDDIGSTPANATCAETEDRIISKLSSLLTGPPASCSPVSEASTWLNEPQPSGLHSAHAPAQRPDQPADHRPSRRPPGLSGSGLMRAIAMLVHNDPSASRANQPRDCLPADGRGVILCAGSLLNGPAGRSAVSASSSLKSRDTMASPIRCSNSSMASLPSTKDA